MLPKSNISINDIDELEMPSLTYRLNFNNKIYGHIDELEAIQQAIFKILSIERGSNPIYSQDYGVELKRFLGKDIDFIKSDIERTITEALLYDDRVLSIESFTINQVENDSMTISFNVNTIFGNINIERGVMI